MNDWMKRLEEYGADVTGALERLGGDKELYQVCIEMLWQDELYEVLWKQWQQAKQGQGSFCMEATFDAAHTLKGVTANLGLTPLYHTLSELVEALRKKDEVGAITCYSAFAKEWKAASEL